jgi:hypothetical protein
MGLIRPDRSSFNLRLATAAHFLSVSGSGGLRERSKESTTNARSSTGSDSASRMISAVLGIAYLTFVWIERIPQLQSLCQSRNPGCRLSSTMSSNGVRCWSQAHGLAGGTVPDAHSGGSRPAWSGGPVQQMLWLINKPTRPKCLRQGQNKRPARLDNCTHLPELSQTSRKTPGWGTCVVGPCCLLPFEPHGDLCFSLDTSPPSTHAHGSLSTDIIHLGGEHVNKNDGKKMTSRKRIEQRVSLRLRGA